MNVYDFDKTIYRGDSSIDFILYLTKKHPSLLKYYPKIFYTFIKYKLKKCPKIEFKSSFFMMIKDINLKKEINLFWNENINKIKPWYLENKKASDLIISASPLFLVTKACEILNVKCIASEVDERTGKYINNFYGEEKVKQFKKIYQNKQINKFYSDSVSDVYLAKIAKQSYLVKGNKIRKWEI